MATAKGPPRIEALNFSARRGGRKISGVSRWTWRAKAYAGEVESIKFGTHIDVHC